MRYSDNTKKQAKSRAINNLVAASAGTEKRKSHTEIPGIIDYKVMLLAGGAGAAARRAARAKVIAAPRGMRQGTDMV